MLSVIKPQIPRGAKLMINLITDERDSAKSASNILEVSLDLYNVTPKATPQNKIPI